jgi:hypothetical protein
MKTEEIIRKVYPELVANELVSVQPMNYDIFCLKYQKPTIPEWVIESGLIQFCDNNRDNINCHYYIERKNNNHYYCELDNRYSIDTDDEKILNENNSVVDKINAFCSLKNLKCDVKVNKIHDFAKGWYKVLYIEITEKVDDLG